MSEVLRKENESFEALMRRFNKTVQRSGRITEVKKRRFFEPQVSPLKEKRSAIRSELVEKKIEYMRKVGKIDDMTDSSSLKKMLKIGKVKNK